MCPLKKPIPRFSFLLIGIILGITGSSIIFTATGFSIFGEPPNAVTTSAQTDNSDLTALAFDVLGFIRDGDFKSIAELAHPDFGVVFSPGATISLATSRRFTSEQIAQFSSDNTVYVWGVSSETGEPIELTPVEYFAQYVYSSDYFNASVIGINRIVRSGNALENITDEFPGVRFVDFHIPGADRESPDDLDWSSLRLGFEEQGGRLWLSVIVHSTWTV